MNEHIKTNKELGDLLNKLDAELHKIKERLTALEQFVTKPQQPQQQAKGKASR